MTAATNGGRATAAAEIAALLGPYGRPAPTLLPWLARWAAADDLPVIAAAAAGQRLLAPLRRWPVVTDAVTETLAERAAGQPDAIAAFAEVLPPLAARLSADQAVALLAGRPAADAFGYAALADQSGWLPAEAILRLPDGSWQRVLAAAGGGVTLPPLANLRLLARLASGRPVRPDTLPGSEAAYLLPYLDDSEDLAEEILEEIEELLPYHATDPTSWYAAAVTARALPFLDDGRRRRLAVVAAEAAPPAWAAFLRRLTQRPAGRWPSVAAEVAAACPVTAELDQLAARVAPGELAEPLADLARQILGRYGDAGPLPWAPDDDDRFAQAPERIITRSPTRDPGGQGPLGNQGGAAQSAPPRFLRGECPATVGVGRPLRLRAWIAQTAAGLSAPLIPFDVPPEGRDVMLVLAAPGLRVLGDNSRSVHVPPVGASGDAEFHLQADAPGQYRISVFAFIEGTHLGMMTAEVAVERDAPTGPARPLRGEVGMTPVKDAVTLIAQYSPRDRVYRFQLIAADYPSAVEHELKFEPGQSVSGLIQTLNELAQGRRTLNDEDARYFLVNKGLELWRNLIPERLQQQFWDHEGAIGQLTILGDGDVIPWEVLYPKDGRKGGGFLVDRFPVIRALFDRSQAHRLRLRPARFVLPPQSPTQAADEVETLRALLGEAEDAVLTEYTPLLRLLRDDDFGVLHFACHNTFDPDTGSAIKFGRNLFTPDSLTLLAEEQGLAESAPLVFVNACRAAGVAVSYNKLESWATQFMEAGAGAFIGSLWEVTDETSTPFAVEIYQQLKAGATLGAAVQSARRAIEQSPADPTWLAYTVYGDARATASQPGGA